MVVRQRPVGRWHACWAHLLFCLALSLIMSGAIGNLIDRLLYGYVIDFLDFYIAYWHWPAFNVADIAIVCGAGLLILESFLKEKSQSTR